MCRVIFISKYSPLNPIFLLPNPPPYPKLQQKKITSMNKGEKAEPYIKRQVCKQTNKLADETEQVINPLINFPFLPFSYSLFGNP